MQLVGQTGYYRSVRVCKDQWHSNLLALVFTLRDWLVAVPVFKCRGLYSFLHVHMQVMWLLQFHWRYLFLNRVQKTFPPDAYSNVTMLCTHYSEKVAQRPRDKCCSGHSCMGFCCQRAATLTMISTLLFLLAVRTSCNVSQYVIKKRNISIIFTLCRRRNTCAINE